MGQRLRSSSAGAPRRPTTQEIANAERKRLPDLIRPGLSILFCGINPGLYSAASGHHFARPGNRFWPVLFAAGFTPWRFSGFEDGSLLDLGFGITNLVARTTVSAAMLDKQELRAGARSLVRKVRRHRPKVLAVVGLGAYRVAFDMPTASVGLQAHTIGATHVWLLPNPSGLNAHHQIADLAELFGHLHRYAASLGQMTNERR